MEGCSNWCDWFTRFHCCCLITWIFTIGTVVDIFHSRAFLQKARAWETLPAWQLAHCDVLAAGVSCVDHWDKSTCFGYVAGKMPSGQPPVFLTEEVAVCPGTYWCATDGEMCDCRGEITFATELFNGEVYTMPEPERAYKVVSTGKWRCGTDQSGQPYQVDPAKWRNKHCWCTPQGILDAVKQHEPPYLHKKECSEMVSTYFNSHTATQRRLGVEQMKDKYRFRYSPWALVVVSKNQGFDGFDGLDKKQLRCAYEYGTPDVSESIYYSSEAYSDRGVWTSEDVAKRWGNESSRPCWVRTTGEPGRNLEACAVALENPNQIEEVALGRQRETYNRFYAVLCFTVFFTGLVGYICYLQMRVCLRERQQRQRQRPSSPNSSGSSGDDTRRFLPCWDSNSNSD
ncbi:unnamed protein product [Symbiodinium necroappetens]|uniref:Uncharacterized protein n=1 Tax=Symbiodinium necroappetens TaxID=1628268 RepID=A0A813AQN3_9DINO|nr:unnamed protein product [Symbiodinium necroappetens]